MLLRKGRKKKGRKKREVFVSDIIDGCGLKEENFPMTLTVW